MAERFGGKYSPQPGPGRDAGARDLGGREIAAKPTAPPRHPHENRPFWITLAAAPVLLTAFGSGPEWLARAIGAFALICLAAMLTREGLRAEAAYDARRVARRPAFPRKILGAILFGLGLGLGAQSPDMGQIGALAVGVIGAGLSLAAFGLDPMKNKGLEGVDEFQQERVARIVAEGEKYLDSMREVIAGTRDRDLGARVERFAATARELFRAVEEDPADLSAARRYMGVYLMGARDASVKFVEFWGQTRDAQARADYVALLDDLEANFTARTRSLIANGREGLEIEIDVLRDRLAREGLALAPRRSPQE